MPLLMDRQIKVSYKNNSIKRVHLDDKWIKINEILDVWRDIGCWWQGEKEKTFYRVQTFTGAVVEIYRIANDNKWFLYRVYD